MDATHTASAFAWTNKGIVCFSLTETNAAGHLSRSILTLIELGLNLYKIWPTWPTRISIYHDSNVAGLLFIWQASSTSINLVFAWNKVILTEIEIEIRHGIDVCDCDSLRSSSLVILKVHFRHVRC